MPLSSLAPEQLESLRKVKRSGSASAHKKLIAEAVENLEHRKRVLTDPHDQPPEGRDKERKSRCGTAKGKSRRASKEQQFTTTVSLSDPRSRPPSRVLSSKQHYSYSMKPPSDDSEC